MSKKKPHARGSLPAEIDAEQLNKILKLRPTINDCAAIFNCSVKAIERFIRREYDRTFTEQRDRQVSFTKNKLIQKALTLALEGDTKMLIFALKNLCDWSEKHEVTGEINVNSITDLLMSADQDALDITPKTIEGEVEERSSDEKNT